MKKHFVSYVNPFPQCNLHENLCIKNKISFDIELTSNSLISSPGLADVSVGMVESSDDTSNDLFSRVGSSPDKFSDDMSSGLSETCDKLPSLCRKEVKENNMIFYIVLNVNTAFL